MVLDFTCVIFQYDRYYDASIKDGTRRRRSQGLGLAGQRKYIPIHTILEYLSRNTYAINLTMFQTIELDSASKIYKQNVLDQ